VDASLHLLVTQPFRKVSTNWPNPMHAGDCEVVPQAVYGVKAVETVSATESAELLLETTKLSPPGSPDPFWWADAVGVLAFHCNGNIAEALCTSPANCGGNPCLRAWELPNGAVNFDDVNAALTQSAPPGVGVPAQKTWVDLHPVGGDVAPVAPNNVINASDLQQIIFGFGGFPYTGFDPKDCDPAVVAW
jgi:hypothetical protein